jgi:hypothetical protein
MHPLTQITKDFVNNSKVCKKLSDDEKFELRIELSLLLIDFESNLRKYKFNTVYKN